MKKLFVINMGSTSTKVAYFEDDICKMKETITHDAEKVRSFPTIWDQLEFRTQIVLDAMERAGVSPAELDAMVTRGCCMAPVTGGVYRVTEKMADMARSGKYGNHVADLGTLIVLDLQKKYGFETLTVDTACTDEFEPVARYTGLKELQRVSHVHALNQKAAARKYAESLGRRYEDMNFVVIHMGGGSSIAAHRHGRIIDAPNTLDGEGPFSTDRANTLPVGDLIDMCYSGRYTHQEMRKKINGLGGLMSYIGETDVRRVVEEIERGNEEYKNVLDAMCYQTAKEIGAMATVLKGDVDAIIFTGGMVNSDYVIDEISQYISYIAPVVLMPGEFEMESLGINSYKALMGQVEIKEI